MAFLDWITKRNQQQPVAEKPQPETAKQMYTREHAQEQASLKRVNDLPPAVKERLDAVKETLRRATQHHPEVPSHQAAGGEANIEALRQNMTGQGRNTPALSPTGGHMGSPDTERISPPITPKPDRQKTIARTPPSWER